MISYDIPLIVDEAHGAHFIYHEAFPESAVSTGADIVIQSLHKTLPAMTQTGLLHLCTDCVSKEMMQKKLSIFQSSSPSYVLMSSIEQCIHICDGNRGYFQQYCERLWILREKLEKLQHIQLVRTDDIVLSAILTFAVLIFLIVYVVVHGVPYLKPSIFSLHYTSENASLMPALINTVIMTFLSLLIAVPFGIFSAIFLVEYAKRGNKFVEVIRLTTETLQGIPSIVYGLFGMLFFVTTCGWGFSILAGAFTLAIMVLPLIMRSTEEALKAVPDSYREGSFGLGAGKLRTVFRIVLPSAVPGILAGVILAIGRIVGETAALIYTAGTVAKVPSSVFGSGRTLAVHMYNLSSEGLYMNQAYATAVVLLVLVVLINTISGMIAKRITKS